MINSGGYVVVPTPGTPVKVSLNLPPGTPPQRIATQAFCLQAKPDNTGLIYIGLKNMVTSTGVGVLGVIGIPTATGAIPSWGSAIPVVPAGLDLAMIYIDAAHADDGVIVSYTVG